MRIPTLLVAFAVAFPLTSAAEGDSPWLPIPGQYALSASYTQETAKEGYVGTTKLSISAITGGAATEFKRTTTRIGINYGFRDAVSFDASVGYGDVEVGSADSDSGVLDSVVGVKWRVVDEYVVDMFPTITLRGAAIINGNYDGGRLGGLGNDANGYELAAIVGKQFNNMFSLSGEVAVQNRSNNVPNATSLEVGAQYHFALRWSASAGYSSKKYGGDLDIGATEFTASRFQEVRDEHKLAKLSIGYAVAHNQGVTLNLAKSVGSGRNSVVDDQVVGVSYTYAL